ncbi:tRNA uridine-5-carboxymethylaminomethyl(34) synthesis GTPase MnmE [Deinococcus taeanensis]|uniref:tRNA uridine-5-carboxymethylaminomethyl(34) synthesis GTPase MnmE n=1 Tax=Deinococcus taeanensis TaxID=2737050 RepID=UPI001CDC1212|nr:tRNA uridine-5-carboxymethylaminomethyl(34) synthesis GTPase MnmE [Deinococcus taeanensis]UBV43285.1 tRNA uridine-5-carboxymethylaminomethyl(34) synthesis GTPase MnmE [Deinococcus taeanensis]
MTRSGLSDTIAAIATAPGSAGVGIVRVSGPDALRVADSVFRGRRAPSGTPGGRFLFGQLQDAAGDALDEGLCLIFKGPRSYTGEDVAELQTHGSPAVLARVLQATLDCGARLARPGEFTLRAYLSGRLDLAQAEAVLGLIEAQTDTARRQATLGLSGALGERVARIGQNVTRTLAAMQAMLDYPEEGVPDEDRAAPLAHAEADLQELLRSARAGQVATRGARLALIGRPNAGKSSLLNALLGYERSIVTPTPGTTRDYLEAAVELAGVPVTLVDTAGIRDTADVIEAAGVRQALSLAGAADLVLALEDGSAPREPLPADLSGARVLHVRTKADLPQAWRDPAALDVSAVTGQGLPELREAIQAALLGDAARGEAWLTTERQADAARRALGYVQAAAFLPDDLAGYELEEALRALADLTGRDVQEDVVDAVFRNFCVGK